MTLTFKNAKYAIDENGGAFQIVRIVENFDDLTERPNGVVARAEAEEINEYDPNFKPCVVVTTAREALEAAWELAYEVDMIPAGARYLQKWGDGDYMCFEQIGRPDSARDVVGDRDRRLLDAPESEPWEQSRFCYANRLFLEREENEHGTLWYTVEETSEMFGRAELAKLNPRPVTIEGEEE